MALHETHRYDDIIDMPHHVSRRHPQMSRRQRAAQFMPFAALTGYERVIEQAACDAEAAVARADPGEDSDLLCGARGCARWGGALPKADIHPRHERCKDNGIVIHMVIGGSS